MAKFDKYYKVDFDGDDVKIANFTDFRPIPNATGKSYNSSATGFTDDAKFFFYQKRIS